ncbi:MAG: hypothetical protein HRF43_11280 [Phycisphaerae bacterium]|jgi:hypothetical protein
MLGRSAILLGWFLSMAAGCAGSRDGREEWFLTSAGDRPAGLASALLFDPKPAGFDAQAFAERTDWPSTVSFHSPGQVIYFSERIVDFQGRPWNFGGWQGSYRRAETIRVGVGYR